jgi:hypothetical protein
VSRKGRKTWVWLVVAAAGAVLVVWLWRRRRRASKAEVRPAPAPAPLPPPVPPSPPPPAPPAPAAPIDMSDEPEIIPRSPSPTGASPITPRPTDLDLWITDEAEALARVIASEAGRQRPEIQTRIAWTARNRARYKNTTIARLVCQPCGKQVGNRRPFSSAQAPTPKHREVAAQVLAMPLTDDPTRGADHILEPGLMDRQFAAGTSKFDARMVRARRLKGGLDYYGSFGGWDFFGPKGGPGAQPVPAAWNLAEPVA